LLTAICAVLCGADGWAAVSLWGRANLAWLQQFLPFGNGVASHDTFGRVFGWQDGTLLKIRWREGVASRIGLSLNVEASRMGKTTKAGVKNRRLLAGWDEKYREKILGMQGGA